FPSGERATFQGAMPTLICWMTVPEARLTTASWLRMERQTYAFEPSAEMATPHGSEPPGRLMVREKETVPFVLANQSYNSLPDPVTYRCDPFGLTAMPCMEAPLAG